MAARTSVRFIRAAAVSGAALTLGACATLLNADTEPPALYDLAAPAAFQTAPRKTVQLLLPQPTASDALATNRVAVRRRDGSLAFFTGVSWSDELPALLQTSLARAFQNSGRVKAVGKPGQGLAIDDQVLVDIRSFELDVRGTPTARVVLGVSLLDDRNGKMIASRVFDVSRPASSDRPADGIVALTAAADDALRQVVDWSSGSL